MVQCGVRDALDEALAAGDIPPSIFVFPEGLQGYWINHADGGPRWADYVAQDVVAHVDKIWSTEARPERRAIGGPLDGRARRPAAGAESSPRCSASPAPTARPCVPTRSRRRSSGRRMVRQPSTR